jgi:signal transduction histidine kinase/ligand-binding sensor domain-containing protein
MILILLLLHLSQTPHWHNEDSLIVTQWTVEDGLPGNSINRVIQDDDGFIWLTSYYGLIRFDGMRFHVLDHSTTPQIRNNRLKLFHKAPDGTVWISLESLGLIRYKDSSFQLYDFDDGLTDEHITAIRTLPDGRLLVGTYDGLYWLDTSTDRFVRIDLGDDSRMNHISEVIIGSDGVVWITTYSGWIRMSGDRVERFESAGETQIVEDSDGVLWISTRKGLFILNRDGTQRSSQRIPTQLRDADISGVFRINDQVLVTTPGTSYLIRDGRFRQVGGVQIPSEDQIINAMVDSYGVAWVISQRGNVFHLEDGDLKQMSMLNPISTASALMMYEDIERNLWVSTRYGGVFRVKRNPISHIGTPEGLRDDNILGLYIDRNDRLFIGTRNDGFSIISEKGMMNVPVATSPRYGTVHDFAEDENGNIWVATFPHGLVRYDEDRQALIPFKLGSSIMSNDIRAIHAGGDEFLWLATAAGLVRFNTRTNQFTTFDRSTGLPSQILRNIEPDSKGRLWISTADNGIFRYDTETGDILSLNKESGLPSNIIRSVLIDPDDESVLWIGSETEGLIRYRQGSYLSVGLSDGLPDRVVHSIRQGPFGWMWITTNSGVIRINKEDLNAYLDDQQPGFHFIVYAERDGMRNSEANGGFHNGSLFTPDLEYVLVSTQSGVARIPLRKPDPEKEAPPVFILDDIYQRRDVDTLLTDGVNAIDIAFAGLRYASPEGVRYQYRMIGLSDEWTDVFNRDVIRFQNLKPGEYVFEVISWNEAGTIASEPARMRITVKALYHQTLWFRLLSIISLIVIIWVVTTIRLNRLKTIQQRLETLVDQKTQELRNEKHEVEKQKQVIEEQKAHLQELNDTKDRFFSIIGHDLRGPFQTLLGLSQLMIEEYDEMDDVEIRQNLKHLRASSENLHRLVENLLEWSSLQKGKDRILMEPIDMDDIAKSTVRLFGPIASTKAIHFEAIVPGDMVVMADRNIVETVIRNLVSNAIKFTKTEGIVVLEAGMGETDWWIQVSDNGIGMSENLRKQVMNIDKSVKRRGTMNEWGTGLGLALCKELISLHDGSILVESEPEIGSRFTVRFPNRS